MSVSLLIMPSAGSITVAYSSENRCKLCDPLLERYNIQPAFLSVRLEAFCYCDRFSLKIWLDWLIQMSFCFERVAKHIVEKQYF
jgi:hypothetical protein